MEDLRKSLLLKFMRDVFGNALDDDCNGRLFLESVEVDLFLDEPQCFLLFATIHGQEFVLKNKISDDNGHNALIFYKMRPTVVPVNNFWEVVSFFLQKESTLHTFYHTLHKVFLPSFTMSGEENFPKFKIRELAGDLERGLKHVIFEDKNEKSDWNSLSDILTLSDESDYWENCKVLRYSPNDCIFFSKSIKLLSQKLSLLGNIYEMSEFIEEASNIFDDMWKTEFPEPRMTNIFDIVGHNICQTVRNTLQQFNVWADSFDEMNMLSTGVEICEKWSNTCAELTTLFWPNFPPHKWSGESYASPYVLSFKGRLCQIMEVKNVYVRLCDILDASEKEELNVFLSLRVFHDLNSMQYNPQILAWNAALNHFEQHLKPIEVYVGEKMKQQVASLGGNSHQLLDWYKKYQNVVKRSMVRNVLTSERQMLLILLQEFAQSLLVIEFASPAAGQKSEDAEDSIISHINRIRQYQMEIEDIRAVSHQVLNDLNDFHKLNDSVTLVWNSLKSCDTEIFEKWCLQTQNDISSERLSLKTDESVIRFEDGKLMRVNYNIKLLKLIKETRSLKVLGFKIPGVIVQMAKKAESYSHQAKLLEQVANFHNTIGDRMIASQRPMMLSSALELSKLVKLENNVTWRNEEAVNEYIALLQSAVERLSLENNLLHSHHMQIVEKVSELANANLLQQKQKWRKIIDDIRNIIAEVARKFSNSRPWSIHWDYQIYKVLQLQYISNLNNFNAYLPRMKVDLIYRQKKVQFNPALEEIRMKYYTQVKMFLTLPLTFQGVSDSSKDIFPIMVERNADKFQSVYTIAEQLMDKIENFREEWANKVALGAMDWENLIGKYLKCASDWEINFRACKAWGQEIAKITTQCERTLDCFILNATAVRSEMEFQNNRYWDMLVISLHSAITSEVNSLQNFVLESKKYLQIQPRSMDEIGEANDNYKNVLESFENMNKLCEEMDKKNKVLSSWNKQRVYQVEDAKQSLSNLQSLLNNQQHFIDRQVENVKSKLMVEASNLSSEAEKFVYRWRELRPKDDDILNANMNIISHEIFSMKERRREWSGFSEKIVKMRKNFERCAIINSTFEWLDVFEEEMIVCEKTWGLLEEFISGTNEFIKEDWIVFREKGVAKFYNFLQEWDEKLTKMEVSATVARLLKELQTYKDFLPCMKFLKGDTFDEKHWSSLFFIIGVPFKALDKLTFGDFLSKKNEIIDNLAAIQELNVKAASEMVVKQAFTDLEMWDVETKITFFPHVDSNGNQCYLIKDFKDIVSKIGDNQCLLQSIISSPNYSQFVDRCHLWDKKLTDLCHFFNNLNQIQRKWLYLEPIFCNDKMIAEKVRFARIDKDLRYILNTASSGDRRVSSLCRISNLRQILDELSHQLSICQKNLNEYLEEKRMKFPRFYFLNNDDLLEILGRANKVEVIQMHFKKLFAGIHRVVFKNDEIVAICSSEGETVQLNSPITISEDVQSWLFKLMEETKNTLKTLLASCLKEGDPSKFPSQILCLAECISFTSKCEHALKGNKLPSLVNHLKDQLNVYTNINMNHTKDSSKVMELKLKALMLDVIHHIAIVDELIENSVSSVQDWLWQKRIRFYIKQDNVVVVKMAHAEFTYSYEYQGNGDNLVRTPLTDKCYLTLTQAMHMGLGGNPYGPAGTGKTESVKALGKLLGRQVLVFNCDEGLDAPSLIRIFIGLVKCGAWGCFDEFNRLEEMTMSAVSTHIHSIQEAMRSNQKYVTFGNVQVQVDPSTGLFITLNPADIGYGGRQKLPANLKQLFRPIAMCKPNDELIAEVILRCHGFKAAKMIASKLVYIFAISDKMLSKQNHYDWGLRALKSVISGCQVAIKEWPQSEAKDEIALVAGVLRLNTLSKLTPSDAVQFQLLIQDIFSGISAGPPLHSEQLEVAIKQSFTELHLQCNRNQIQKCLELYEQMKQRMGVIIVGPSGTGKSTICKLLKQAVSKLGHAVNQYTLNPKSMPRQQFLGYIDVDTRQWIDGVLSNIAQKASSESSDVESWIVCDGDVDPDWIESLNSVLDDNHLLTLPSGWRIQLASNVHFIFEAHHLINASPATISRMGVILLSDMDLDVKYLVENWLEHHCANNVTRQFVTDCFYKAIEWIKTSAELVATCSLGASVKNCLSHLLDTSNKSELAISLINGFGANLTETSKESLAKLVLEWTEEFVHDHSRLMYCYFNVSRNCVDVYADQCEFDNASSIVCTPQVKTCSDIMHPWICKQEPFAMIGPQGCGKSSILAYCVRNMRGVEIVTVHCGPNVTPRDILQKLSRVCVFVSTNNGILFRPKNVDLVLLRLKDLNFVQMDKWGSNILISFLQQVLTYGGFYNNLEWVSISNIQITCTLTHCNPEMARYINLNRIIVIRQAENSDIRAITTFYLQWLNLKEDILSMFTAIIVGIFVLVKENFTKVSQIHYAFTLTDLRKWCEGLKRYDLLEKNRRDSITILMYEGNRILRDRLVDDTDKTKYDNIASGVLNQIANNSFHFNSDEMEELFICEEYTKEYGLIPPLRKCHIEHWNASLGKLMKESEMNGDPVDVKMMLPELSKIVCYAEQVLTTPGGSLIMPGYCGYGRKSAVHLIARRQSARIFYPKMHVGYALRNFKSDLKAVLQMTALENKTVYLVLEDYQFVAPEFADYVGVLLASGEAPDLYQGDEFETLCLLLKNSMEQSDHQGNECTYFIERVRRNFHLILITDCHDFGEIWGKNAILLKECRVIWSVNWNENTMLALFHIHTSYSEDNKVMKNEEAIEDKGLPSVCIQVHSNAQVWMKVTPRHFLSFVKICNALKNSKEAKINEYRLKLEAGLFKLTEAKNVVAELKGKAAVQENQLAEKKSKANAALERITNTMQNANTRKAQMESLREMVEKEKMSLSARKSEIDQQLSKVEPILSEARAAVGNIKSDSLSEIRSLRAPPEVIRDILEGVLRLMGVEDTSWNSMKMFLSKRGIKEDIRFFDARNIHPESRKSVEELLKSRDKSFEEKTARRASAAAAPLAAWVIANVKYSQILEKIKPLETEQFNLESKLGNAQSQMASISSGLDDVEHNVSELKEQLNANTKEAAEISVNLVKERETIAAAEQLVAKLDGEYCRWGELLAEISQDKKYIPYYCVLAAAVITYLSEASETFRREMIENWKQILKAEDFEFGHFLSTEQDQLQWISQGLAPDYLSMQNAILMLEISKMDVSTCARPLAIDPTYSIIEWMQKHMQHKNVDIVSQNDDRFQTILELAIRFGKVLIIRDVSIIDPILVPILRGNFLYRGNRKLIAVGDKLVDYNESFQLFLVSHDQSIQLPAFAATLLSTINFAMTHSAFAQMLLKLALSVEKPELEIKRMEILIKEAAMKSKLLKLSDDILKELAGARGQILENKALLSTLNETKKSSDEIRNSLSLLDQIRSDIGEEYKKYKPIADFGATVYFTIEKLRYINNIYQISADSFIKIYKNIFSSQNENGSHDDGKQIALVQRVYCYVARFLFKEDLLPFAIHLIRNVFPSHFQGQEWNLFTRDVVVTDVKLDSADVLDSLPSWISKERASDVFLLKQFTPHIFQALSVKDGQQAWRKFMEDDACVIPSKMTPFQQVLIMQALKPGCLHSKLSSFASKILGFQTLSPGTFNLNDIYQNTTSKEPILILTCVGADPQQELRSLARDTRSKYYEMALGERQVESSLKLLADCVEGGQWLILTNLHLITSWLPTLEKFFKSFQTYHENFRLWLISEGNGHFPATLSKMCLKITYEPPEGMRRNVQRTFEMVSNTISLPGDAVYNRIIFALCWFHALVQERRSFIPQAWSKYYEFSDSDFQAAANIVKAQYESGTVGDKKLEYTRGLCECAIYGGRIDSDHDSRILSSYLKTYLNFQFINGERKVPFLQSFPPQSSDVQNIRKIIQKLPESNSPDIFGLPLNADRFWQSRRCFEIISCLKILKLDKNARLESKITVWKSQISPILHTWKQSNQGIGILKMKMIDEMQAVTGNDIETCMLRELNFAISLSHFIHAQLVDVNKVIRKTIEPDESMSRFINDISEDRTPEMWLTRWNGPKKPLDYIRGVMNRCSAIMKLQKGAHSETSLNPLDLSSFFNPKMFLTFYKQHKSKEWKRSLDSFLLKISLLEHNDGFKINGISLEGAYFDHGKFILNTATSPIVSTPPDFSLTKEEYSNRENGKDGGQMYVPLYENSSRDGIVDFVSVDIEYGEKEKWIQANVAFYLRD